MSGLPQRDGKRNDPYHDASKGRALFSSYFVVLLVFVCVEPSVLRHLSPAEGRLLLLQDQELHSQIITFFFPIYFDSQTVCDWISAMEFVFEIPFLC